MVGTGAWAQPGRCGAIRISQIYPGGGSDSQLGSTYGADFVELMNASGTPVDVSGWLLAYGPSNGTTTFGCAGCTKSLPAGTVISPCGYLLVQMSYSLHDPAYGAELPNPDITYITLDLTGIGTLALLSSGAASGHCLSGINVEDLVGWGGASCSWVAPVIDGPVSSAAVRKSEGVTQTYNNRADFDLGAPVPHNSTSPKSAICISTPAQSISWGAFKSLYR